MSTPAGRMATLAEFANTDGECESLAADHQGELDTVSADVTGDVVLCERPKTVRPGDVVGDRLPVGVCDKCRAEILEASS